MKNIIKKILGEKLTKKLIAIYKYIFTKTIKHNYIKSYVNNDIIDGINEIYFKNKHAFCGYYDLDPINDNKILVHILPKKRKYSYKTEIEIGYYNLDSKEYKKVTDSKAWSWQQGTRARWTTEENCIYYNDVNGEEYCTRKLNIKNNQIVETIPMALYDISNNEEYGISVNFSRIQRLRPGYGYKYFKDVTVNEKAPKDDGLFKVNLKTYEKELIISLEKLAEKNDSELKYDHYINHVSISPSGKYIMFFHIYLRKGERHKTELCIIQENGENLRIIEQEKVVSHYTWKNDEEILVTVIDTKDNKCNYRIYNALNKEFKDIEKKYGLDEDGHPTYYVEDTIITDTYPNNYCMQTLLKYNISTNEKIILSNTYSNPLMYDEQRCDLHPKLSESKKISIDTTMKNNIRGVVIYTLKK